MKDLKEIKGFRKTKFGFIPDDWGYPRLEQVSLKITDGAHSSPSSVKGDSNYPMYSVKNMGATGFTRDSPRYISKEDFNILVKQGCKPKVNDILIAKDGSVLKYSFVIESELNGVLLSSIAIVRPDLSKIDPYYVCHYLKQSPVQNFVVKALTSGSGVPRIILQDFKGLKIPLPSLLEQNKIAQILSTWDELIEKQTKLIEAKEKKKKGLMQKLLTGELRFPGFEGEWEEVKLEEVSKTFSGGTPSSNNSDYYDGNIHWISSGELNQEIIKGTSRFISDLGLKNSSAKLVESNTLLIAMYGATAGVTAITKIKGAINQAVLAVIPKKEIDIYFLFQLVKMKMPIFVFKMVQGGQPNLSGGIINSLKLKLPTLEEQNKIASVLLVSDKEIELLKDQLARFQERKKGLMQQLLTGKIRINNA